MFWCEGSAREFAPVNQFPGVWFFRLSPGGVECDKEGLRVSDVTLLALNANGGWTPRADGDLATALSRLYGFPRGYRK